jgi:hypothetical protein
MDHSLGSHPGQRSLIPLLERKVRVRFGAFVLIVDETQIVRAF